MPYYIKHRPKHPKKLEPQLRVRIWFDLEGEWYYATVLTGKTRKMHEDEVGPLVDHVRILSDHLDEPRWVPVYRIEKVPEDEQQYAPTHKAR